MKINRIAILLVVLAAMGCASRRSPEKSGITVTIAPLKYIAEGITGDDFDINVMVPAGASPETYEPTPLQMMEVENSHLVLAVGLMDFERSLVDKLSESVTVCDLSRGVKLLAGTCSHGHAHGIDPHIWMSPRQLRVMARNAYEAVAAVFPDSVRYADNYGRLVGEIDMLDSLVEARLDESAHRSFVTFHPVFTYYAADYGLNQIALESEGKEPSAARIKEVIEIARRDSLRTVVCQSQMPSTSVETVAGEIGAKVVVTDPLSSDVRGAVLHITDVITR